MIDAADNIIATNLRRLRALKGLSQDKLAAGAGLSRGAYRKIEAGEVQPRVRNLEALAVALKVPVRTLLEPAIELRHVRFRSHKKLRTRSQILTDVGRWLADYNALEDILDVHRPFTLDRIAVQAPSGEDRPRRVAHLARQALGLAPEEPIRDICGLLDSAGIKLFPMSVASEGFFGLSVGPAGGGPAVVVNTWERISVERWIFSAAHELGHLLLHFADYEQDEDQENPDHEREADAFAAEFLMPDAVFQREWAEGYGLGLVDRVIKVKRIFRVSYRTVLHRIAPTYTGWGNIWVRFQTDYHNTHGHTLAATAEPAGLSDQAFHATAGESLRSREPDHLSPADFREDRLALLVRRAIEAGEISLGRGAEILGLSLKEMRERTASWVG